MGIVIRQSFYSSISAYIGVGIGYLNAIILMPLFMEPEEIGLMRAIMSIAMLLTFLSSFGMGSAIIRFLPIFGRASNSLNRLFSLGLLVSICSFTILSSFLWIASKEFFLFFEEKSPEIGDYLSLIILLIFQMTLFKMIEAIPFALKEIILPNFVRDLLYKFLHALIILMYGFDLLDFRSYLFSHTIIYVILIIALGFPVIVRHQIKLDFSILSNTNEIKDILGYASIVILSGLGMTIIIQVDQIMIAKYLGLATNGIYTLALFMAVVIELPSRFVSQVSSPIISEALTNNDFMTIKDHYKKASTNQLILGFLIFILILINLENVYVLMPNGSKYTEGWWPFCIIGIVKLVDMVFSLNGEIIAYSKYYKFNLYSVFLLSILAVVSNYILIPKYGLIGASVATLISFVLFNVAKFLFIKIKFGFSPFSISTVPILISGLVVLLFNGFMPLILNSYLDIICRSFLMGGIFVTLIYLLKVSDLFNSIINQILNKLFKMVIE